MFRKIILLSVFSTSKTDIHKSPLKKFFYKDLFEFRNSRFNAFSRSILLLKRLSLFRAKVLDDKVSLASATPSRETKHPQSGPRRDAQGRSSFLPSRSDQYPRRGDAPSFPSIDSSWSNDLQSTLDISVSATIALFEEQDTATQNITMNLTLD